MTGRSGQMLQTTTAEVRLDEGNAASFGPARRATRRFDCQRGGLREGISLRGAWRRRKIGPNRPGIRGMSDERCELSGTIRFLGQFATSAIAVITVSSVAGQSEGKSALPCSTLHDFARQLAGFVTERGWSIQRSAGP
jgi:hypothetical protein